jgi:hypothetical protein
MTTVSDLSPFDLLRVTAPPESIYGGDMAIGANLAEWVSGGIKVADILKDVQQRGHAYLPFAAIGLNGWRALRRILTSLKASSLDIEMEAASRYTCPYTRMEFWGLVPLGVLARDASLYKKAFTEPGAWAYVYDQATEADCTEFVGHHLGNYDASLETTLQSVALVMLGAGYTDMCMSDDGNGERMLVTVDFANGDKLICAAWVWFND